MPRPRLCRKIRFNPNITYFKPQGVPMRFLDVVELTAEEVEALRLKNDKNLDQFQAAQTMKTSRSTFQRILSSAYKKITKALVEGRAIKILTVLFFLLMPVFVSAQEPKERSDVFFKAEVIDIIEQKESILPDGSKTEQQNILLRGIEGPYKEKEVEFNGIGDFDLVGKNIYQKGDLVLVVASHDAEGNPNYYITDYVRTGSLWWLAVIFCLSLIVVGQWKGLRSLLALAATFFIIVKYIVPQISSGANPLWVTILGSFFILLAIIYITEGFRPLSHISVISIFFSLLFAVFISWAFVLSAKLTGVTSEEILFLVNIGEKAINFKGLLLAGIIIGALGVLDDVVISQVASVEQIFKANKSLNKREIFSRAYKVGVSHIASMTNTLFLAYAGVSLPLIILFISGESAFAGWGQIVNNEMIATEIIRALAGSIGLILSVPIATFIAVWWYVEKK